MFYLNARDSGVTIEMSSLMLPQVNLSSEGDTYVDAVGNTYAETVNQTRMTLSAARRRIVGSRIGALVSANTGTVQLYNFTDGASLGTKTTTSVVEAAMDTITSSLDTNLGDAITLRVKNSNAGQSMSIVSGGMLSGDVVTNIVPGHEVLYYQQGGFPQTMSFVVARALSTTTYRVQCAVIVAQAGNPVPIPFGSVYTEATAGAIQTVRLPYVLPVSQSYGLVTLSAVGNSIVAMSNNLASTLS